MILGDGFIALGRQDIHAQPKLVDSASRFIADAVRRSRSTGTSMAVRDSDFYYHLRVVDIGDATVGEVLVSFRAAAELLLPYAATIATTDIAGDVRSGVYVYTSGVMRFSDLSSAIFVALRHSA